MCVCAVVKCVCVCMWGCVFLLAVIGWQVAQCSHNVAQNVVSSQM